MPRPARFYPSRSAPSKSVRRFTSLGALVSVVGALLLSTLPGCSGIRLPDPATFPERTIPKNEIVILVPGITGVKLRNPTSGRVAWGRGANLLVPRDGGYELALPILGPGRSPLEPFAPLREIRLGFFRKPVYGPIFELLEEAGYEFGKLADPEPTANLFAFSYDWRGDNVAAARQLASRLENLRKARGSAPLQVTLICQSNGGHICRYLAKYGDTPLDKALTGGGTSPEGLAIEKIIFVGTSNGGSLRMLQFFNEGRKYLAFGRKLQPETLFTYPSLFQDLPSYREDVFLDPQGQSMEVDLFDAENWHTYGWSVFGEDSEKRLARAGRPDLFGSREDRDRFLKENLERARKIQRALRQDSPSFGGTRYLMIQSVYRETPDRAVLVKEKGRWGTYFSDQRRVKKDGYLRALAAAPGDGHAARASQTWLSPQEIDAIDAPPFYLDGPHFEMILEPAVLRRLVEFLAW